MQELDDAVLTGLEDLDEAINEHLRESEGDVDTARSSLDGYSARYPRHPCVERATNALSAFTNWEPDGDAADRWVDPTEETEPEPSATHTRESSGPSIFDDLAPLDDLVP